MLFAVCFMITLRKATYQKSIKVVSNAAEALTSWDFQRSKIRLKDDKINV